MTQTVSTEPVLGGLTVEAVETTRQRDAFLQVPYLVHADDPTWVPPLLHMEKQRLSPKHGPFFKHGEAQLFVASRDGVAVGRISAHINHRHQEYHHDDAGHFGLFDCIDDQSVADALFAAAADWLRERKCQKMVGPFNFTINEECGLQIEGFDSAPAVFMTQARPYTRYLLERAGFEKEVDLLAYRVHPLRIGSRMARLTEYAHATGRIAVRPADMSRRKQEVELLVDIFNDSWRGNWGFSPMDASEVEMLLGEFTRFIRGQYARFVSLDGEPVGVMVVLPNYNEAIKTFRGRLLPFNWAKLVRAMLTERFRSGRVVILGIRKSVQNTPIAGAMVAILANEIKHHSAGYDWVEFSWVLETNKPMCRICEMTAGPAVKRYRMYGRAL